MALTQGEQERARDLEECGRVGEQFRLGAVEAVHRELAGGRGLRAWGWLTIALGVAGGVGVWSVLEGLNDSPSTLHVGDPLAYTLAVVVPALVAGWLMIAIAKRLARLSGWTCLYSGGVARIELNHPEPTVLHWADLVAVTVNTGDDDGTPTLNLTDLILQGRTGIKLPVTGEITYQTAAAAYRVLAPRVVPAMIATYDSERAVVASPDARVGLWGVVFPRSTRRAWTDFGVVVMEQHPAAPGVTTRVDLSKRGKGLNHHYCDPSGVPNGIFLFDLIAHAARQRGLRVESYVGRAPR